MKAWGVILLLPWTSAQAMEQTVATATTGAIGEAIGMLVPVLVKIITSLIPILFAAHIVIIQVRYWRVDNREDGEAPYTKRRIREKVYNTGKWWGVFFQTLFQPAIYMMMGFSFEVTKAGWWSMNNLVYTLTSAAMILVSWMLTGMASRLLFDFYAMRTAARADKSDRMRRWHKWLMVEHRETHQADHFQPDDDPTLAMTPAEKRSLGLNVDDDPTPTPSHET